MPNRLRWCLPLKLQQLLLKVGDCLCPCLKLSVLRLHVVLKVDNPVGTDLHLLPSNVEQQMGMVPSMLGVTKATVNLLQLAVLLGRWTYTAAENDILMPQPLDLAGGGSVTLLIR
jgi:hypothetical protein